MAMQLNVRATFKQHVHMHTDPEVEVHIYIYILRERMPNTAYFIHAMQQRPGIGIKVASCALLRSNFHMQNFHLQSVTPRLSTYLSAILVSPSHTRFYTLVKKFTVISVVMQLILFLFLRT